MKEDFKLMLHSIFILLIKRKKKYTKRLSPKHVSHIFLFASLKQTLKPDLCHPNFIHNFKRNINSTFILKLGGKKDKEIKKKNLKEIFPLKESSFPPINNKNYLSSKRRRKKNVFPHEVSSFSSARFNFLLPFKIAVRKSLANANQ